MLHLRTISSTRNSGIFSVHNQQLFDRNTFILCNVIVKFYSKNKDSGEDTESKTAEQIPEAPTTCCMSGCANCVWLEYAERLTKIFADSGEKSQEIILSKVTDENMKAFLKMEFRNIRERLKDENSNDSNQ